MVKTGKNESFSSLRRRVALVLLVCFLLPILGACHNKVFKVKEVGESELARLIVASMIDIDSAESFFYKIPEEQRDDMSFSEYYEYVTVLKHMLPKGNNILSFDIISGSEKEELINQLLNSGSSNLKELFANCVPVKLEIDGERLSKTPVYFYLQRRDNGKPYLSRIWARRCMDIYAFSEHYFTAYQKGTVTDIVSLLKSNASVDESLLQAPEVLSAKAEEMIRFYASNVKTEFDGYELCSVDAANLLFMQPEVFDTTLHTKSRFVRFSYNANDQISVDDSITSELKTADLYLYYNGRRALRIGDTANAGQLAALFGLPISVSYGPLIKTEKRWGTEEVEYRNIFVRYKGFSITVYGRYNDETDWEGNFVHFRIWNSKRVSIGAELLSTQSTTWDMLKRYPFADMTDYDVRMTLDNEHYALLTELAEPEESEEQTENGIPFSEIMLSWERSN